MRKISVSGFLGRSSKNFNQFKIQKIDNFCKECGGRTAPGKPFGMVYLPKSVGMPEQIIVNVRGTDEGKGE